MKQFKFAFILLFALTFLPGCVDESMRIIHEEKALTCEQLKALVGDALLYPDNLTIATELSPGDLKVYYYPKTISWEYSRTYNNFSDLWEYDLASRSWRTRAVWGSEPVLALGLPILKRVTINSLEPKHAYNIRKIPVREAETANYQRLLKDTALEVWQIEGEAVVRHYAHQVVRDKNPEHASLDAYALFMHKDILYRVDAMFYGHPDESEAVMIKAADNVLRECVTELLGGTIFRELDDAAPNELKTGDRVKIKVSEIPSTGFLWSKDAVQLLYSRQA